MPPTTRWKPGAGWRRCPTSTTSPSATGGRSRWPGGGSRPWPWGSARGGGRAKKDGAAPPGWRAGTRRGGWSSRSSGARAPPRASGCGWPRCRCLPRGTRWRAPPAEVIALYHRQRTSEKFHSELPTERDLERWPAGPVRRQRPGMAAGWPDGVAPGSGATAATPAVGPWPAGETIPGLARGNAGTCAAATPEPPAAARDVAPAPKRAPPGSVSTTHGATPPRRVGPHQPMPAPPGGS